jgi:tripartite ATP-independent transporter DctM subunit
MNVGFLSIMMFGIFILLVFIGLPISFALGSIAIIFTYLYWGNSAGLAMVAQRAWEGMNGFVVVCVPLYIFMGVMLERSGIADDLFKMIQKWSGGIRGALSAGTVFICMILAAMVGLSGASTVAMGLVALPQMLRRNYSKDIALGSIMAGGALGILIPPSATMVIYAMITQQSVGQLYAGGIIPGIILGSLFIAYVLIRCYVRKADGPALPLEERSTWGQKLIALRAVILPALLIFAVLGSVFMGVATPTESAALGAFGTIICAAIYRRLTWTNVKEAAYTTLKVSAMAMWIYLGSMAFTTIYYAMGATEFVKGILISIPGGPWAVMIAIQIVWIILGCLLDPWGIIMITGPIFAPVVQFLGFDLVWFGVAFIVNMEMAYLTPPFGMNLFYMKGVAPKSITMNDIVHSVWPFVACQLFCLILVMVFPQLILWLPVRLFRS